MVIREFYRLKLEKDEDGKIIATSPEPDLKGLVTQGDTEEEAVKNAHEAATLIVEDQGLNKKFQEFYLVYSPLSNDEVLKRMK